MTAIVQATGIDAPAGLIQRVKRPGPSIHGMTRKLHNPQQVRPGIGKEILVADFQVLTRRDLALVSQDEGEILLPQVEAVTEIERCRAVVDGKDLVAQLALLLEASAMYGNCHVDAVSQDMKPARVRKDGHPGREREAGARILPSPGGRFAILDPPPQLGAEEVRYRWLAKGMDVVNRARCTRAVC